MLLQRHSSASSKHLALHISTLPSFDSAWILAATMANDAHPNPPIADKEIEVPEWEHEGATDDHGAATQSRGFNGNFIGEKLDATMPPHRKYLGMRRNIFLAVLLASILALLALIIGLSVGLTQKPK